jgi:hydroxyacylglutathione hydrolase
VVDAAIPEPVWAELDKRGWTLTKILNTHHHMDHVGANLALKEKSGCQIIGPKADENRIPGIDVAVGEGDEVSVGSSKAKVFDVPGHTKGHIAYWFEADNALFCGDTLFAMGCGRLFEGTPAQMYDSLNKFKTLPDETAVYCAHEYTQSNGRFALTVEPDNQALISRMAEVDEKRAKDLPTVPSNIGAEKATNPFMRAASAAQLGEIRQLKDNF